jgi:hypothetical protein
VLKKWLFTHRDNPYPSEAEKRQLAKEANLDITQVRNWYEMQSGAHSGTDMPRTLKSDTATAQVRKRSQPQAQSAEAANLATMTLIRASSTVDEVDQPGQRRPFLAVK